MASTWEDTVMGNKQVDDIFCPVPRAKMPKHQALVTLNLPKQLPYLEAQAEITWHARDKEVEEARKLGRKDVVDFIESHLEFDELATRFIFDTDQEAWRDFKNEELR